MRRNMKLLILCALLFFNINAYAVQPKSEATTCMYKALDLFKNNKFPEAMTLFTHSLELADSLGDDHLKIVCIGYISNIYFNAGDYGRCYYYQSKGYEMALDNNEEYLQKNYLSNMVATCAKSGRMELAKKYIKRLRELVEKRDDNTSHYYLLYDEARICTAEGKYDDAIKLHLKTLQYAEKNKMAENFVMFQYLEIAQLQLLKGNYTVAVEWGKKCLKPEVKDEERDFATSVYKLLADAYMMLGDKENGNFYNNRYFVLQDSVFNRGKFYSAGNDLLEYENRKTGEQIDSLNGTISRQFITLAIFAVLLVALAIVSILLFRNNRQLNYAYRLLIRKDKEMGKQEERTKKLLEESILHNTARKKNQDVPSDSTIAGDNETSDEMAQNELPSTENPAETQSDTPVSKETCPDREETANSINMSDENKNRLLNSVIEVMNNVEYISKPDFGLNTLAEAVGSNTRYVSWVINDTYGKNFKTLLNECRIKEACRRLLDTEHYGNMTIQAIYEEVGYSNNVSFIRAFKRVNGMTPSEYQRQYRMEESSNMADSE